MDNTKRRKFATISIDDASEGMDYSIIKNYIISDEVGEKAAISFDHPTTIEGIAFVLCLRGSLKMKIDMREYGMAPNMLLTVLPGSICEITEYKEDILIEFLFFSIDFAYDLNIPNDMNILEKIKQHPLLKLTEEQFDGLLEFHSFMIKQYKRVEHLYRELLAKNLLASFLTEVSSIYRSSPNSEYAVKGRKEEIYQQFLKLLFKHIKEERTVQFYADKMCLSPKYLSQLIKEISGKPIMEWINELTIVTIKSMLKTSNMTVLQISEELNFPNPSFFGRYFKKHTGMTPVQYREH